MYADHSCQCVRRLAHHSPSRSSRLRREFAIGEQPSIGGHHGTAKLEHQEAVKIEPNSIRFAITACAIQNKLLIGRLERSLHSSETSTFATLPAVSCTSVNSLAHPSQLQYSAILAPIFEPTIECAC